MNLKDMEAIAARAGEIRKKLEALAEARHKLFLINKHGPGKRWQSRICLVPASGSYARDVDVVVTIPFAVVQQQSVNEVALLERQIVQLGGNPWETRK